MEHLVGVYISGRKSMPVSYQSNMVFTSGRKWPRSICGKFIVRKATAIGLLHIDDAKGEWVVSVGAMAPAINPMLKKKEIRQLPITPENEALVFPKKQPKKKSVR